MPLARIITRSHQCSRELALDLLERGYTVEVVSPDNIPDNIADLELRVEAGPDQQLIANVEVHDGDRSASLDFVHYLKTPLADFVRRPPETKESAELRTIPIAFNGEVSVEDLEVPVEVSASSGGVAAPNHELVFQEGIAGSVEQSNEENVEENARLVPAAEPEQSWSGTQHSEPVVSTPVPADPDSFVPAIIPPREPLDRKRSGSTDGSTDRGWRWRPAFTVASAIILALVVRFGISHAGKSPTGNSPTVGSVKITAPSPNSTIVSTSDSSKISRIPAPPPPDTTSPGNTAPPPIQSPVMKSQAVVTTGGPKVANQRDDGLVARDTVTYLDRKFNKSTSKAAAQPVRSKKPALKKAHGSKQNGTTVVARKSTPRHSSPNTHRSNGIAPDTVTYLDKAPTPKTTKQN